MDMGAFRGIRRLGGGTHGEVWLAAAPDGARVALKVLALPSDKAMDAARRELALAARIDHPHLLGARSVVCEGDRVALVLPWAAGGSLADLLARRATLTVAETLTVLIPVADVLAVAHERGVVHGDLSPANILLTADGRPLVADLGAGRLVLDGDRPIVGTPGCVAPEVARGGIAQPSSDVFALAAIGLWCVTGRPAWNATDLRDVVVQSTVGQWPDPGDAAGPPRFLAALRAALSDLPAHRPGAAALRIELARSGEPEPLPIFALGGAVDGVVPRPSVDGSEEAGAHRAPVAATVRRRAEIPPAMSEDADDVDAPVALQRIRRLMAAGGPAAEEVAVRSDGRPRDPSSRSRWWRAATGVVAAALICAAAIYGGLSWGRSSAAAPASEQPASTATGSRSSSGRSTAPSSTAPSSATPSSAAPSSSVAPAVKPPADTVPTPAVPTDRGASSAPGTARPTSAPRPPTEPHPSIASQESWASVVTALDGRRARALITRDPALLGTVYAGNSSALTADRATIRRLQDRGWRVGDARHRVREVQLMPDSGAQTVRVRVVDELPSYPVTDGGGGTVGRTSPRAAATSIIELVQSADGYRIRSVERA